MEYYHILVVLPTFVLLVMGLNKSLSILGCLQSRKYCETIMDDILLFTPDKKFHILKLEDLLKALFYNGIKILLERINCLKEN